MTLLSRQTSTITKSAIILGSLALIAFHSQSAFTQSIEWLVLNKSRVEQSAPDFSLSSVDGRRYRLSAQTGHMTDVIFFCGCDRCHKAAKRIGKLQQKGQFQGLVSVIALNAYGSRQFQRETGLAGVVLADPSDHAAELYNAMACPRLIVVANGHRLVYESGSGLEREKLQQALIKTTASNKI